ncbi:uncharacterized protein LOC144438507 isoform X3 [Glandiceps talaboti]
MTSVNSGKWDPSTKCSGKFVDYDIDEVLLESKKWIEAVSGKKFPYTDFRKGLEDGVLLCELMSKIKPGCIRKINRLPTAYAGLDNVNQFLRACEELGLSGSQLFDAGDLQDITRGRDVKEIQRECDRRLKNVCITLYWLGKAAQTIKRYRGPQLNLTTFTHLLSPSNLTKDLPASNGTGSVGSPVHSASSSTDQSVKSDTLNNNIDNYNHKTMNSHKSNRYSGQYDYNYSRDNGYRDDSNRNSDDFVPTTDRKRKDDYGSRRHSMPVWSQPKATQYIVATKIEHARQPSSEVDFTRFPYRKDEEDENVPTKEMVEKQKEELDSERDSWMSSLSSWKTKRIKATSTAREFKAELEQTEQEEEIPKQRRGSKTFAQMLEDRESRERAIAEIVKKPEVEDRQELNRILTEVSLEYNSDNESQHSVPSIKDNEAEVSPRYPYSSRGYHGRSSAPVPRPTVRLGADRSAIPSNTVSKSKQPPPPVAPRRIRRQEAPQMESKPWYSDDRRATTRPVIIRSAEPEVQSKPAERSAYREEEDSKPSDVRKSVDNKYNEQPAYRRAEPEPRQPTHHSKEPTEPRQPAYQKRQPELQRQPAYQRTEPEQQRQPAYQRPEPEQQRQPAYQRPERELPWQQPTKPEENSVDLAALKVAEKKRVSSGIQDRLAALTASQTPMQKQENRRSDAFNEMTICINQRPRSEKGFGFSIIGGMNEDKPVTVKKVTLGGSADICELHAGDEIMYINNQGTASLSHDDALHAISQAVLTGNLQLRIRRYSKKGIEEPKPSQMKVVMPTVEEVRLANNSVPTQRHREEKPVPVPAKKPEVRVPRVQPQTPEERVPHKREEVKVPIQVPVEEKFEISRAVEVHSQPPPEVIPKKEEKPRYISRQMDRPKPEERKEKVVVDITKAPPKQPEPLKLISNDDDDLLFYGEGAEDSDGELSPSEEERLEREIMEQLEKEEEEARQQEERHKKIEEDEKKAAQRKESVVSDDLGSPPPLPSEPPPNVHPLTGLPIRRERRHEVIQREQQKRRANFFRKPADMSCMPMFGFSAEDEKEKLVMVEPQVAKETKDVTKDVEALWLQVEKIPAKKTEDRQEDTDRVAQLFEDIEKPPPMQTPIKRFDIVEERKRLEKWQREQDEQRRQKYLNERKRLQEQYAAELEKIHSEMVRNQEAERKNLEKYERELFRLDREHGLDAEEEARKRREIFEREESEREADYQRRKEDLMAIYEQDQQRLAEEEHFETKEDNLKHEESAWTLEKDKEQGKKQEIEVKKRHIERERRRTQELDVEVIRNEVEARLNIEWEQLELEKRKQEEREKLAAQKLEDIRKDQEKIAKERYELERRQKEERMQLEAERSKIRGGPPPKAMNLMPKGTYSKFAALSREPKKEEPAKYKPEAKPQKSALKKPKEDEKAEPEKKVTPHESILANKSAYKQFAAIPQTEDDEYIHRYKKPPQEEIPPPQKVPQHETSAPSIISARMTPASTVKPEEPLQVSKSYLTHAQPEPAYTQYYRQQQPPPPPPPPPPHKDLPERDVDYRRQSPEKVPPKHVPTQQQHRSPNEGYGDRRTQPERDPRPQHSVMSKYKDENLPPAQHWLVEEAERRRRAEREGFDRGSPYELSPPRKTSPLPPEKPQRDVPPPTELRYDERYMYAPPERDNTQKTYKPKDYNEAEPVRRPQRETDAERNQKKQKRRTFHAPDIDNRSGDWQGVERRQRSLDDSDRRRKAQNRHSSHDLGSYSGSSESLPHGAKKNNGPLPGPVIQNLTNRASNINTRPSSSPTSPQRTGPTSPQRAGPYQYQQPPTAAVPPAPAANKPPGPSSGSRSVSGKVLCTRCGMALGRGAAMIIESLGLHFHMQCFKCCVCNVQLGNGARGTDVRIRASRLHCQNCYSNDAGFEFTEV